MKYSTSTLRWTLSSSETVTLVVKIRQYTGTFFARCNGKTARSICCGECAAVTAGRKAAQALVELGVIPAVPTDLTIRQIGFRQLYHVDLGPANTAAQMATQLSR